jgi:hypothetical protein
VNLTRINTGKLLKSVALLAQNTPCTCLQLFADYVYVWCKIPPKIEANNNIAGIPKTKFPVKWIPKDVQIEILQPV